MKTKKASVKDDQVKRYEQSVEKARTAFDEVSELGKLPAVKKHLAAKEAAKRPDERTQERKTVLSEAHDQLYYAIRKLNYLHAAVTSDEVREGTGDNESMGLHLLMTEIVEQLQKVDDKILKVQAA